MNIYEKLLNIQAELKAPKGQRNNFGNYNYRSCEDILEAVKPLLTKYKATIIIDDEIINVEGRFYIKATVTFIDVEKDNMGQISVSALAREDEQQKGMSLQQLTGSTSSYARKYSLGALFLIDDGIDSDATNTHEVDLTEKQVNRIYAIAFSKGISRSTVDSQIKKKFNKEIKKLTKEEYEVACKGYEGMTKK